MKYLFARTGRQVLESLSFTRTLYAFDFDGTLAPIISDPKQAGLTSETSRLLRELSQVAPTAIVSGRSIADLKTRVNIKGNILIGNHGVEGLDPSKSAVSKAKKICQEWSAQLDQAWGSLRTDPGTFVENKTYSLALHYRKSRNKKKTKAELFSKVERLQPTPRVILGKCVMNLVPSGGPHKGVALLEAMMKLDLRCAFYIGDDDTDEDVFSLPDKRVITVRVGQKRTSQAQFFMRRQNEIGRLLRLLLKTNSKRT